MSYEIVRSIKLDKKNKKVYVTGASNNVTPRTYMKWETPSLTEIFEKQGEVAVIKEILDAYYSGNFQPGNQNHYSKSLALLDRSKFNWDNGYKKLFKKKNSKIIYTKIT